MSVNEKFSAIRKGLLELLLLQIIGAEKVYVADILKQLSATEFATPEGTLYPLPSKTRREGPGAVARNARVLGQDQRDGKKSGSKINRRYPCHEQGYHDQSGRHRVPTRRRRLRRPARLSGDRDHAASGQPGSGGNPLGHRAGDRGEVPRAFGQSQDGGRDERGCRGPSGEGTD